jgi:hypothetical protein
MSIVRSQIYLLKGGAHCSRTFPTVRSSPSTFSRYCGDKTSSNLYHTSPKHHSQHRLEEFSNHTKLPTHFKLPSGDMIPALALG